MSLVNLKSYESEATVYAMFRILLALNIVQPRIPFSTIADFCDKYAPKI